MVISDATQTQLGSYVRSSEGVWYTYQRVLPTKVDIKVSEALVALDALDSRKDSVVEVFVDNMAIKYFLLKGTCR